MAHRISSSARSRSFPEMLKMEWEGAMNDALQASGNESSRFLSLLSQKKIKEIKIKLL